MMNKTNVRSQLNSLLMAVSLLAGLGFSRPPASAGPGPADTAATQVDLHGPAGSGAFGTLVVALPNGNVVVTDPHYSAGSHANVGAVYLYNGHTRALISALTGRQAGDQVGLGGVTPLSNGNYVVDSSGWANGAAAQAGAVTWCSGTLGCTGVVTVTNSLVGSQPGDGVGNSVTALSNGNYVVDSNYWANGAATLAGAATWCSGTLGCTGVVTTSNSLVGSQFGDQVGHGGVTALSNGNYVVDSPYWSNGAAGSAGAATWGNGATGTTGVVTTTNSLVGSQSGDQVSNFGITPMSNGNYVVDSPYWANGAAEHAGAATWGNGATGTSGAVTVANSLVGSKAENWVGISGIAALSNGNYVVASPNWASGAAASAGAATWGNGATGTSGAVTVANSLVGSRDGDRVGFGGVTALSNGNYVVASPNWANGAATQAGAATWGNGATGITGMVTTSNSLVGSQPDDLVGKSVTALSNGNYVVDSYYWANGAAAQAGAATWGNGATGTTGVVTVANSLVGSQTNDLLGNFGITPLSNGNYVVASPNWANGAAAQAGAATWGNGATGTSGAVTVANSLVGSQTNDQVGNRATALSNGNYVVASPNWANGAAASAGAVTWGDGAKGTTGVITINNSVLGGVAAGGNLLNFAYDYLNNQLVVGRPAENLVTFFILPSLVHVYLPLVRR
jgi:hypothetical protein